MMEKKHENVTHSIHAEWLKWRKIFKVTYDNKITTKLKDYVFYTTIKPDKLIWGKRKTRILISIKIRLLSKSINVIRSMKLTLPGGIRFYYY